VLKAREKQWNKNFKKFFGGSKQAAIDVNRVNKNHSGKGCARLVLTFVRT
jgi:hypothetical protein